MPGGSTRIADTPGWMTGGPALNLVVVAAAARAGGPLRYLEHCLPRMVEAFGDGEVVLLLPEETAGTVGGDSRVRVIPIARDRSLLATFVAIRASVRELQAALGPDTVVFFLGNLPYTRRGRSVTLIQNAARVRDLSHPTLGTRGFFVRLAAFRRLASWFSTEVIAVSAFAGSLLPRPRPPVTVVYHGVDGVTSPPRPVDPPTRPASRVVVVPGALAPYKNIETALVAVSQVPDVELVLVGGEPDARYARFVRDLVARLHLQDRVRFTGAVSHEELLSWLTRADVVLVPSRAEACPNVLLETCVHAPGALVLGWRSRWSDEYAHLFDARFGSADELASRLRASELTSAPAMQSARAEAVAQLTWDACAARTVSVLRRVALGATCAE